MPPMNLYGYHVVTGTVSIVIAASTTISSGGGWGTSGGVEGATADGIIDRSKFGWGGIACPSTFDGTVINFSASTTRAGTYYTVYDEFGVALLITTSASRVQPFPARLFAVGPFFKVVTATAQATTDTVFEFVMGT